MRRLLKSLVLCGLACIANPAAAESVANKVTWTDGGKSFDGYLVFDNASKALRPGLVMVPNWWGVTDAAVAKAKTLAGKDYVILLVDMYGRVPRPTTPDEAGKASGAVYADPVVLRSRINTALKTLRASAGKAPLDTKRIGAIGFCFGGAVALELARSGADLAGVATFHGALETKLPAKAGVIKEPVLVMTGADDGFVPAAQVAAFEQEMRNAKVDWQVVKFGGAVHCFAEPDEHGQVPGCQFHAPSYRRSVRMMHDFFDESFAKK